MRRKGYVRVRIDGEVKDLEDDIVLDKNRRHTIEVVVDRIVLRKGIETRLADSLETTLKLSEGLGQGSGGRGGGDPLPREVCLCGLWF